VIRAEIGHNYEGRYVPLSAGERNDDFIARHWGRPGFATSMGRVAIDLVLRHLDLRPDDEIYVTTTYGTHYVSSIVTCAIFNYCRPSKVVTDRTRAIYVIHEFGVPHGDTPRLTELARHRGIPLIEDCAYCIDSWHDGGRRVGEYADYVIHSLPKVVEVPHGGILVGPVPRSSYRPNAREQRMLDEIEYAMEPCYARAAAIAGQRNENWAYLLRGVERLGLRRFVALPDRAAPYCFPFLAPGVRDEVIAEIRRAGYEAFAWRGGEIVVTPVHQELLRADLDTMLAAVERVVCGSRV